MTTAIIIWILSGAGVLIVRARVRHHARDRMEDRKRWQARRDWVSKAPIVRAGWRLISVAPTGTIPIARIVNLEKSMVPIHIEIDPMTLLLILSAIRIYFR